MARLDTLPEIEAALWQQLAGAVRDKAHPWRTPVLATADGDGADARTVVLRDVEAADRTLLVFTDSRSAKARQVAAHPAGTLVMWSPALGWQLRLRVVLTLETEGLRVSSRWARLKLTPAAQDYMAPLPPGSTLGNLPGNPEPPRESRGHFAVLAARVVSIDWLELQAQGHRRALFDAAGGRWVMP